MESSSARADRRRRRRFALRAALIASCAVLVVAIGFLVVHIAAPAQQQRTSNRDYEQAKANIIQLTAWVAGVSAEQAGKGSKQGCASGTVGEGPPWLWSQEYDIPYSDAAVAQTTARLRQLRDKGWHYVETQPELERIHTKLGVQVSSDEQVSIDAWRSSKVNIEDDVKAGKTPEQHTISIVGLSECTN